MITSSPGILVSRPAACCCSRLSSDRMIPAATTTTRSKRLELNKSNTGNGPNTDMNKPNSNSNSRTKLPKMMVQIPIARLLLMAVAMFCCATPSWSEAGSEQPKSSSDMITQTNNNNHNRHPASESGQTQTIYDTIFDSLMLEDQLINEHLHANRQPSHQSHHNNKNHHHQQQQQQHQDRTTLPQEHHYTNDKLVNLQTIQQHLLSQQLSHHLMLQPFVGGNPNINVHKQPTQIIQDHHRASSSFDQEEDVDEDVKPQYHLAEASKPQIQTAESIVNYVQAATTSTSATSNQNQNHNHNYQDHEDISLEEPEASHRNLKEAKPRALLALDSNRLVLPHMNQIKARFNQGCVGGTKCQFFAFCWMSGGSLGASCGLLMTCCVTPSRQEIQPGFYGPVVNDPYCGRSTNKISRIVGGTDASFGQFPWQAFVQVGGSRCGGALISSRHVVTAGHCVARSQHSPSSIKVTLGDYILNSDIESIPHEVFSVVEVLLHPNFRFTPQADRYDVAVLELDRQANYKDNIKPICLPQKDATFVGRVSYVAGWGALQAGSKLRPKVLQHVAVPVIENQVCESWHRRKGIDIRIYDEMMCAGYEQGQRDACQGDSGGPLMLNQFGVWYLVGIVSAGYSCAKQYQPGIYHRVSSSSDWISSNVYQHQSTPATATTSPSGH